MFKKSILIVCALLFALCAFAQTPTTTKGSIAWNANTNVADSVGSYSVAIAKTNVTSAQLDILPLSTNILGKITVVGQTNTLVPILTVSTNTPLGTYNAWVKAISTNGLTADWTNVSVIIVAPIGTVTGLRIIQN